MNHEECTELLVDHHFSELDRETDRRVAEHLSSCAACALEYCRLRLDLKDFGVLSGASPRPEVREALRAKVEAEFVPGAWARLREVLFTRIPIYQPALILLVVVLAGAVLWRADRVRPLPSPSGGDDPTTVLDDYDAKVVDVVGSRIL